MRIERATTGDLDEVAELFDAYRVFYGQASDLSRAQGFIGERLAQGDAVIFVARDAAGAPVGFIQLYPCFSSVSTGKIWILNDLYVSSAARRQGVGAALLRQARDFGVETGALRIELATAHTNVTAQALYVSEGYVLDKEFRRFSLPLGK